jgi:protein-tyrosine-phosphatase
MDTVMARAWFERLADPAKARAWPAGTEPADRVHPEVQDVMHEKGFDLSNARPQKLTPELTAQATLLVTMGCGESCPYVPGVPVVRLAARRSEGTGRRVRPSDPRRSRGTHPLPDQ